MRDSSFQSYESENGGYHAGSVSWFSTMRLYLTQYFLLLLVAVLALSFVSARFAYGWMAWHARQRLILGETPEQEEESDRASAL